MRILLLGATGRTGKLILEQALAKDHQVSVLVRNSKRIKPHPNLDVFEGDVTKAEDLSTAIVNCHYVISCLNVSRTSDFPWSKLRTPPTLLSETINSLLSLRLKDQIKKVIICSAWGVAETKKDIPGWFRWFIENSNIGVAYKDHERQEELLKSSKLNFTIVRPVGLTNGKLKAVLESQNDEPKPKLFISRKSVASYMLDQLSSNTKTVVISNK